MLGRIKRSRGDTLIEVLFATATFSFLAVGGIAIMNKGIAASQRALEITLVRNEIDSQAKTLRFLNASYIAAYNFTNTYDNGTPASEWNKMREHIADSGTSRASDFGSVDGACPAPPNGSFILNPKRALFINTTGVLGSSQVFSQLVYDSNDNIILAQGAQGIWVEGVQSSVGGDVNQANAGYIDFHIRACWSSQGQSEPVTLGTIVRLYEPR
jgi:type II secretory pathway pseudopilin PulG